MSLRAFVVHLSQHFLSLNVCALFSLYVPFFLLVYYLPPSLNTCLLRTVIHHLQRGSHQNYTVHLHIQVIQNH